MPSAWRLEKYQHLPESVQCQRREVWTTGVLPSRCRRQTCSQVNCQVQRTVCARVTHLSPTFPLLCRPTMGGNCCNLAALGASCDGYQNQEASQVWLSWCCCWLTLAHWRVLCRTGIRAVLGAKSSNLRTPDPSSGCGRSIIIPFLSWIFVLLNRQRYVVNALAEIILAGVANGGRWLPCCPPQ